MSGLFPLGFAAGAIVGVVHARMLWQTAKSPPQRSRLPRFRWLIVVATLATAAAMGCLVPAAIGWGISYGATVGIIALRVRT